jgi:exonuclease III
VVLCWNIRGINAESKWDVVRSKVSEAKCDILCLQETKRVSFNANFTRKFCPRNLDEFVFLPSQSNSGGSIIIWDSSKFSSHLEFQNQFAQSVEFTCKLSGETWILTNVYAPCVHESKLEFLRWLKNVSMPDNLKWLIVGDFNLIRRPENRNKEGGNLQEMMAFNETISFLGLVELPLRGCKYTWTNKHQSPLLERLDWFFVSNAWTSSMPNTFASRLTRDISDHTPCIISASTNMPKPSIFRFENYWLEHDEFLDILTQGWNLPVAHRDSAKSLTAKFKNLRKVFKAWKSQLLNLARAIANTKDLIQFLDLLEEFRDLSLEEWNFRAIISLHLQNLLHQQKIYWKQRGTISWVKFGDECTAFFHANASIKHTRNTITSLKNPAGQELHQHEEKAKLLWLAFKERMGTSEFTHMYHDLGSLLIADGNLSALEMPFAKEEIDCIISDLPNNKSPGPDGFNGEFLKRCWTVIAQSFYKLCEDFYAGTLFLRSINSSYITLVPKVDSPASVGDFRPISLLNSSIKLITKILAKRLQKVIVGHTPRVLMQGRRKSRRRTPTRIPMYSY